MRFALQGRQGDARRLSAAAAALLGRAEAEEAATAAALRGLTLAQQEEVRRTISETEELRARNLDTAQYQRDKPSLVARVEELKAAVVGEHAALAQDLAQLAARHAIEVDSLKTEMLRRIRDTKLSLLQLTHSQVHDTTKRALADTEALVTELQFQRRALDRARRRRARADVTLARGLDQLGRVAAERDRALARSRLLAPLLATLRGRRADLEAALDEALLAAKHGAMYNVDPNSSVHAGYCYTGGSGGVSGGAKGSLLGDTGNGFSATAADASKTFRRQQQQQQQQPQRLKLFAFPGAGRTRRFDNPHGLTKNTAHGQGHSEDEDVVHGTGTGGLEASASLAVLLGLRDPEPNTFVDTGLSQTHSQWQSLSQASAEKKKRTACFSDENDDISGNNNNNSDVGDDTEAFHGESEGDDSNNTPNSRPKQLSSNGPGTGAGAATAAAAAEETTAMIVSKPAFGPRPLSAVSQHKADIAAAAALAVATGINAPYINKNNNNNNNNGSSLSNSHSQLYSRSAQAQALARALAHSHASNSNNSANAGSNATLSGNNSARGGKIDPNTGLLQLPPLRATLASLDSKLAASRAAAAAASSGSSSARESTSQNSNSHASVNSDVNANDSQSARSADSNNKYINNKNINNSANSNSLSTALAVIANSGNAYSDYTNDSYDDFNQSNGANAELTLSIRGLQSRLAQLRDQAVAARSGLLLAEADAAAARAAYADVTAHLDPSARFVLRCLLQAARAVRAAEAAESGHSLSNEAGGHSTEAGAVGQWDLLVRGSTLANDNNNNDSDDDDDDDSTTTSTRTSKLNNKSAAFGVLPLRPSDMAARWRTVDLWFALMASASDTNSNDGDLSHGGHKSQKDIVSLGGDLSPRTATAAAAAARARAAAARAAAMPAASAVRRADSYYNISINSEVDAEDYSDAVATRQYGGYKAAQVDENDEQDADTEAERAAADAVVIAEAAAAGAAAAAAAADDD